MVNPKPGTEVETSTAHAPQFLDLPVPKGFVLQADRLQSNIQEAGAFRFGRQTYIGTSRPLDVVQYFEERLPHHGWTLVQRSTSSETASSMLWRKVDTTARIEVSSLKGDNVQIQLRVGTSKDPDFVPR